MRTHKRPTDFRARAPGLLSLEESAVLAHDLPFWSAEAQQRIRDVLQEHFDGWLERWGVQAPAEERAASVRLRDPVVDRDDGIDDHGACDLLAVRLYGEASRAIRPGSPSMSSVSPMALEIAREAWADWLGALRGIVPSWTPSAGARSGEPGSWQDRLHFSILLWEGHWNVSFDVQDTNALLGPVQAEPGRAKSPQDAAPPKTVPLAQALRPQPLACTVDLLPVPMSLGELTSLSVGDVVALGHRLDQPAFVHLASQQGPGHPLCQAWLGQHGGCLALELLPFPGQ